MKLAPVLIPIGIIILGGCAAAWFMASRPSAPRTRPLPSSPLVLTIPAEVQSTSIRLRALGKVIPALETALKAQVTGRVVELAPSMQPGGLVRAGDVLLRIEKVDYEHALQLKQAALAKARADLAIEQGQQQVARAELKQLEQTIANVLPQSRRQDMSLALRAPYLEQARANVAAAETEVRQARLDLDRTELRAPFNAMVTERSVSLGSQAGSSETLATLTGTDTYWVEAGIPLNSLYGAGVTEYAGLPVKVMSSTGQAYDGTVLRTLGVLDSETRMGRILVAVEDPLGLHASRPPLLLGDQVHVELEAGRLEQVIRLPRAAVRNGGQIWVAQPDGTLDIRPVNIAWKDTEFVYLQGGIVSGETVIVSDLAAPVQGMPVRVSGRENKTSSGTPDSSSGMRPGGGGTDSSAPVPHSAPPSEQRAGHGGRS